MTTCPFRGNRQTLPARMAHLPIDERGYVIPWFVDYYDGKPEFRAMDPQKWLQAVRFKRCWVCGVQLGRHMTFVAGPMCGINRTSSEPPSHLECARWSAQNCPFLNDPHAMRRTDEVVAYQADNTPGFSIPRNPGVAMLWTTEFFTVFDDGKGKPLIMIGEPSAVEWWREGRAATREEVLESINGGIPTLTTMAAMEKGGLENLREQRLRFERWLP